MANRKKSKSIINVGVDVGKQFLDIWIYEKSLHWQDDNSPEGIKRILKRLAHYQVERLVMEATGRYEFNLAASCVPQKTSSVHRKTVAGSAICWRHQSVGQNRRRSHCRVCRSDTAHDYSQKE